MGRAIKNPPPKSVASKLVSTGEYIMSQVGPLNSDVTNYTLYTYNYPKVKAANETYLYFTAHCNALEAYSYAPSPCIRALNQTSDKYNGSNYHWGMTGNSEREFALYTHQNYAHSETLDGRSPNISSSNIGIGTVPIVIRWETNDGGNNRPGHTWCPDPRSGSGSGGSNTGTMDQRGEERWYGYLRVWEIAY